MSHIKRRTITRSAAVAHGDAAFSLGVVAGGRFGIFSPAGDEQDGQTCAGSASHLDTASGRTSPRYARAPRRAQASRAVPRGRIPPRLHTRGGLSLATSSSVEGRTASAKAGGRTNRAQLPRLPRLRGGGGRQQNISSACYQPLCTFAHNIFRTAALRGATLLLRVRRALRGDALPAHLLFPCNTHRFLTWLRSATLSCDLRRRAFSARTNVCAGILLQLPTPAFLAAHSYTTCNGAVATTFRHNCIARHLFCAGPAA